ncbi:hypothetical protein SDC9_124464 [bioreactor metagenome]|uniref:Uncharacterized protein n=1 Tax=bioreactor metagenome TaxID=1076179 RepID=A0A645CKH6_9ZZZZ
MNRLVLSDGLAELHAVLGVLHGLVERKLQRAHHHHRARTGAKGLQRLAQVWERVVEKVEYRCAIQTNVIGRHRGNIAIGQHLTAFGEQIDQRKPSVAKLQQQMTAVPRPFHVVKGALQRARAALFLQRQRRLRARLVHGDGSRGVHTARCGSEYQPRNGGFGQRQRHLVIAHQVEHRVGIAPARIDAAFRFRLEQIAEAQFIDLLPQRFVELPLFHCFDALFVHLVGKQFGGCIVYEVVAHLSPIPLAIIPRRISRVPPLSENDGVASVRKFITVSRSDPVPMCSSNNSCAM